MSGPIDRSSPVQCERDRSEIWWLLDAAGRTYPSTRPRTLGGHRRSRSYGRLGRPSALRALASGHYSAQRVFFADERTAVAAGYGSCVVCLPERYVRWRKRDGGHRSAR